MKNILRSLLVSGLLLVMTSACSDDDNPVITVDTGGSVQSVYLDFYHYLDLDSGFIDSAGVRGTSDTTVDFWIAYNSNSPDFHGAIFQRSGREVAILDSVNFESITQMQVDSATYYTTLQSDPFDTTTVFLLKTDFGAIYKIGNPVEITTGVTFDYALMSAAP